MVSYTNDEFKYLKKETEYVAIYYNKPHLKNLMRRYPS